MSPLEIAGICIGAFVLWVLAVSLIIFWNHCANDDPLEDCRDGLKPWPNSWFNSSGS